MADRLHELIGAQAMNRERGARRLREQVAQGRPIIGAGAGTGLSAKCAQDGGADLIIIYNSGRYRMAGRGSLAGMMPYGDANAIVMDMAREVLPIARRTPVLAGVCGTDPFRLMPQLPGGGEGAPGFTGVQNFPTVGLIDGTFRAGLEETGMGYGLEVEMIRAARELDLLTCPYVFTEDEARAMADAGADVLVPHMGLTTGGTIGARTGLTLDEAVGRVQALYDAAREVNPDILCLCHGGPIAEPDDAAVRPGPHHRHRRLLRRLQHGAAADRGRDDGEHAALQVHPDSAGGSGMSGRFITDADIARDEADWGVTGWVSRPSFTGSTSMCVMDVHLAPGGGHAFHRHPDQEEIIWVREGRIEQWLEEREARARPRRGGLHPQGRRARLVHGRATRPRSSA